MRFAGKRESNKLKFVAASQQRDSDRKAQQTEVYWTPETLVFCEFNWPAAVGATAGKLGNSTTSRSESVSLPRNFTVTKALATARSTVPG